MSLKIFPGDFDDDPAHVCPECGDPWADDKTCSQCLIDLDVVESLDDHVVVAAGRGPAA